MLKSKISTTWPGLPRTKLHGSWATINWNVCSAFFRDLAWLCPEFDEKRLFAHEPVIYFVRCVVRSGTFHTSKKTVAAHELGMLFIPYC